MESLWQPLLATGRVFQLALLVVFFVTALYLVWLAKRGKVWSIRKFSAVEAIPEAIGRATETGLPVYWAPGDEADLRSAYASQVIASLGVLSAISKLCARYGAKLICSVGGGGAASSDVYPLVQEIVQQSYLSEGKIQDFKPENIRYVAERVSWEVAIMGWMYREGVAAGIWIGPWAGLYLGPAGIAAHKGAIQIGGTARIIHICTMACMFDYLLIGEEIFAAAAQLSENPTTIATVAAQDLGKYIGVTVMIIGIALLSMGIPVIQQLLKF